MNDRKPLTGWRHKAHTIIFEADTPLGKIFDVSLLILIVLSVLVVILESVKSIEAEWGEYLRIFEIAVTILFTCEYLLRLISTGRPLKYMFSFFGIIDLLSIIPTYFSFFYSGAQSLLVIRTVRLLRIFRVLKLVRFVGEAQVLNAALRASARKIIVFIGAVLSLTVIVGAIMYLVEGEENGFTSIPQSMYWAIVTMTTVGYGDVAPQTELGKFLASFVMIMGYGILAVPTGIVSVELANKQTVSTQCCTQCAKEGHDADATFCKYCGSEL